MYKYVNILYKYYAVIAKNFCSVGEKFVCVKLAIWVCWLLVACI